MKEVTYKAIQQRVVRTVANHLKGAVTTQLQQITAIWKLASSIAGFGGNFFKKENQKVRFLHEVSQISKCCSGWIQPTGHEFAAPALVRQLFPFSLSALSSPTWLSGYSQDVDTSPVGLGQQAIPLPN